MQLQDRLTIHNIEEIFHNFENELNGTDEEKVHLDASAVETVDTAGIQFLLYAHKKTAALHKKLKLTTNELIDTAINNLGLSQAFQEG